jgi:murein DD-endopeptidase MepM/ murein hydrolase activator NlpD
VRVGGLGRLLGGGLLVAAAVATPAGPVTRPAAAEEGRLTVTWSPSRPRVGDVGWVHVRRVAPEARVEGSVGGRPLTFFPYADGQAALAGFDVEGRPGAQPWRIVVLEAGQPPRVASGRLTLLDRRFAVQRLTLPPRLVELDAETERRVLAEAEVLRTLYRIVSPERLWRGRFVRPVAGGEPGTGFGARRVINGKPRAPHTGVDYAAPAGTPVVAANDGRVALVADYFFPGRLVVLDHGLGLYTLYFHLQDVLVETGDRVARGQPIGSVGATGRATGPHLHFGAHVGAARVDPATLLDLDVVD